MVYDFHCKYRVAKNNVFINCLVYSTLIFSEAQQKYAFIVIPPTSEVVFEVEVSYLYSNRWKTLFQKSGRSDTKK
jgi:hypothetical protein